MRTIKFRGKRIDTEEWVCGDLIQKDDSFFISNTKHFSWVNERPIVSHNDYFEVDPATVGQFIELNDKNGVEIYEGDICKLVTHESYADTTWRVEYFLGAYRFFGIEVVGNTPLSSYANDSYMTDKIEDHEQVGSLIEVIGNIHEERRTVNENKPSNKTNQQ